MEYSPKELANIDYYKFIQKRLKENESDIISLIRGILPPRDGEQYSISFDYDDEDYVGEGILARVYITPAIPHKKKGALFEWQWNHDGKEAYDRLEHDYEVSLTIDCADVDGQDGGLTIASLVAYVEVEE